MPDMIVHFLEECPETLALVSGQAYIREEDSVFDDETPGSASIYNNIWDLDLVNGRVRVPYVMAPSICKNIGFDLGLNRNIVYVRSSSIYFLTCRFDAVHLKMPNFCSNAEGAAQLVS